MNKHRAAAGIAATIVAGCVIGLGGQAPTANASTVCYINGHRGTLFMGRCYLPDPGQIRPFHATLR